MKVLYNDMMKIGEFHYINNMLNISADVKKLNQEYYNDIMNFYTLYINEQKKYNLKNYNQISTIHLSSPLITLVGSMDEIINDIVALEVVPKTYRNILLGKYYVLIKICKLLEYIEIYSSDTMVDVYWTKILSLSHIYPDIIDVIDVDNLYHYMQVRSSAILALIEKEFKIEDSHG